MRPAVRTPLSDGPKYKSNARRAVFIISTAFLRRFAVPSKVTFSAILGSVLGFVESAYLLVNTTLISHALNIH